MRIAVLTENINSLANWQLRILQHILSSPELEFSALIINKNPKINKQPELQLPSSFISRVLLKTQWFIERKFFFKKPETVNILELESELKNVENLEFDQNNVEISSKIIEKVRQLEVDLILQFDTNIDSELLAPHAKNGIYLFKHNGAHISSESPIGFWEIIKKEATVIVSLQNITRNNLNLVNIDQAHFNKHWSLAKTTDMVLESSVALLLKNLKLNTFNKLEISFPPIETEAVLGQPSFLQIIKYSTGFYHKVLSKVFERIATKLFKWRYQCFTLLISKGQFNATKLSTLRPIDLPKNEFWADPFLFQHKNETYVFFENYPYSTKRGKISCGKLKDDKIIDVVDILDLDYHLSYPFVFKENGEIFLMPESSENQRLDIYKCLQFPHTWELHSSAFEGELVADAFFYNDEQNIKWLFLNKGAETTVPLENELHIYKVESGDMLKNLTPHHQNPVLIDSRIARNGGAIFNYNNEVYRPSQCNDQGIYGRALNINKIKKLSLEEYEEETIKTVEPDFYKGLMSIHHLHQTDDSFVIDVAYAKH
ncbi:hypothetical protein [Aurantibacter sp.]|uniref:glucosamine inositolphosphorylceramide transferase family protein n=1 Tax=Aurantibacter sp. TaxID=2807103 RepID=UPI0032655682